jgi:hypothetical protein
MNSDLSNAKNSNLNVFHMMIYTISKITNAKNIFTNAKNKVNSNDNTISKITNAKNIFTMFISKYNMKKNRKLFLN